MNRLASHSPRVIGPQNAHILDTATDAYRAAMDLAEQGFTVLSITIGESKGIVKLLGVKRLKHLFKTLSYVIKNDAGGRSIIYYANHKGATVEWEEQQ